MLAAVLDPFDRAPERASPPPPPRCPPDRRRASDRSRRRRRASPRAAGSRRGRAARSATGTGRAPSGSRPTPSSMSSARYSARMPRPSIGCAAPRCCQRSSWKTCAALPKAACGIAEGDLVGGDDVGVELAPDRRCGRRDRRAAVGDRRQHVVVDRDQRGGVLGEVAVVGDHDRDGLADIGDLAVGERERPTAGRAACRNWNGAACAAGPAPARDRRA